MPNTGGLPNHIDLIGSPVVGGGSITCSITIDSLPSGGATVQVSTDHPSVIVSPSSQWPYGLVYASGGGTTASFTITTNSVQANTNVLIYACESGVDISDPANRRVTVTLTVTPDTTGSSGGN